MIKGKEFKEMPEKLELTEYIFNEQEYELACYIFSRFKNVNPNTVFQYRGEILGIGDPAKHLYCYYIIKDGELLLKFKNESPILPIDKEAITDLINKTILLFSNNDWAIKRLSVENKNEDGQNCALQEVADADSDLFDIKIIDFFNCAEKEELQKEQNKRINIVDYASVRLSNCLSRASKNRLGDILFLTKGQFFKIRNFGRKCFEELFYMLKAVANGVSLTSKDTGYYKSAVELLNSDGNYLSYRQLNAKLSDYDAELKKFNYKREAFPIESLGWYLCIIKEDLQMAYTSMRELSTEKILSEYSTHKADYPQLYNEISNVLDKLICEYLKKREGKIFALRLGLNSKEGTLQNIADVFGLSRERIRQYEKRTKKIFNSKLDRAPIRAYCEILALKKKMLDVGVGGFIFALIKFKRENLAKYLMSSFFNDIELNVYHLIKSCLK